MTEPITEAIYYLKALELGAILAIVFDILTTLPCSNMWKDILYYFITIFAWFWLSFEVCCGDIRLPYLIGAFGTFLFWNRLISPKYMSLVKKHMKFKKNSK